MKKNTKEKLYDPFPPQIRTLAIAAPASFPDKRKFASSCRIAEKLGLTLKVGDFYDCPRGEKYFSCDTPYRIREMNGFIRDEEVDMIYCARGGYGSAYLLPFLDYEALKKRKKPLMIGGFSDITALHLALLAKNISGGIVCPMFGTLEETVLHRKVALSMRKTLSAFLQMHQKLFASSFEEFQKENPILKQKKICTLSYSSFEEKQGKFVPVTAPIVPANLTLLTRLCSTEYFPALSGKLLLVEEVGELPRKIDFSFLELNLAHILENCAGVILGQYTDCGTQKELRKIFRRASGMCGRPFYGFMPFGHGRYTLSLICGEFCHIGENGDLSLFR